MLSAIGTPACIAGGSVRSRGATLCDPFSIIISYGDKPVTSSQFAVLRGVCGSPKSAFASFSRICPVKCRTSGCTRNNECRVRTRQHRGEQRFLITLLALISIGIKRAHLKHGSLMEYYTPDERRLMQHGARAAYSVAATHFVRVIRRQTSTQQCEGLPSEDELLEACRRPSCVAKLATRQQLAKRNPLPLAALAFHLRPAIRHI